MPTLRHVLPTYYPRTTHAEVPRHRTAAGLSVSPAPLWPDSHRHAQAAPCWRRVCHARRGGLRIAIGAWWCAPAEGGRGGAGGTAHLFGPAVSLSLSDPARSTNDTLPYLRNAPARVRERSAHAKLYSPTDPAGPAGIGVPRLPTAHCGRVPVAAPVRQVTQPDPKPSQPSSPSRPMPTAGPRHEPQRGRRPG